MRKYNLDSVCCSYRHDFGILNRKERNEIRTLVEEVIEAYEKEIEAPSVMVIDKSKEQELKFPKIDILAWFIFGNSCFFFFSSIMFLINGDSDKWFSRLALSILTAGLFGLLYKARKDK